jgi:hypothetical protein
VAKMAKERLRINLPGNKAAKYFLYLLLCTLTLSLSCTQAVKKDEGGDNFERQVSEISTDEMPVGDDLNFYGADSPSGAVFFLKTPASFLRGFAIKPLKFTEGDKTIEELNKQINTSPIYQMELYELEKPEKLTAEDPAICGYLTENSAKVKILFGVNGLSFRVRERNWVAINRKVDPEALVFVRLGIGEPFSIIQNNAPDALWISAKKNDKDLDTFTTFDKKKIISWTCQEVSLLENRRYEALYYNPDIVFQYD